MSIDFRPDDPKIGWDHDLNLNVANRNAALILQVLGLPPTMEGEIDPDDLLARVLIARGLVDDTGTPDAVENRGPGATVVECGLAPGYYADRLLALDSIATYAHLVGVKVVWY